MFDFTVRESKKARRLSIAVHPDGRVEVVKLVRVSVAQAERFVASRSKWIESSREYFRKREERRARTGGGARVELPNPRRGSKAYEDARKRARILVQERLQYFNGTHTTANEPAYGFTYGSISIRNQKTRWGSCSAQGNLSFNYRIVFLPPHLADYIIVHELCHTKQHNHSPKFWDLVARTIPEHAKYRRELQNRYEF